MITGPLIPVDLDDLERGAAVLENLSWAYDDLPEDFDDDGLDGGADGARVVREAARELVALRAAVEAALPLVNGDARLRDQLRDALGKDRL